MSETGINPVPEEYEGVVESDRIEVLLYSFSDELTQESIAERVGIGRNKVSSYLAQAKKRGMLRNPEHGKYRATVEFSELLASFRSDFQLRTDQEIIEPETVEPEHDWEPLKQRLESEIEEYWPVLAYAFCNAPGESLGGSINQDDIIEQSPEIDNLGQFNNLLEKAKEEGYVEIEGKGDWIITEKGAEIIAEGFELDEKNVLYQENEGRHQAIIVRLKSEIYEQELEKYWPALAYAFTGMDANSIFDEPIDDLIEAAEDKGYIECTESEKYVITDLGEELLQEGFKFNEDDVLYETRNDWGELLTETKNSKLEEIDEFIEDEERVLLERLANEFELSKESIEDHLNSHNRYEIDGVSGSRFVELIGSSDIKEPSQEIEDLGERITVEEAPFGNGVKSKRDRRREIKRNYERKISNGLKRLDGSYTFNQLAAELEITPNKAKQIGLILADESDVELHENGIRV